MKDQLCKELSRKKLTRDDSSVDRPHQGQDGERAILQVRTI